MIDALAFFIAVPLAVELIGAVCAVFDASGHSDVRAAALERVALPLFAWGALWWLIGAAGWPLLVAAVVFVVLCHIVAFYAVRWALRRPRVHMIAIDTESEDF